MTSGDIKENPGSITEEMCKETVQNQKSILSKLSALRDKHHSFEVQMSTLQKRLSFIERKVEATNKTQRGLGRLQMVILKSSDKALRLANRIDDLNN